MPKQYRWLYGSTPILLCHDQFRYWRLIDNYYSIFNTNHPDSSVDTQKKFRLDLAENFVPPLLDLMVSPTCPAYMTLYLHTAKGRRPVSTTKRLIGKHFAYRSKKKGRCLVCCKPLLERGRIRKRNFFVNPNVIYSYAWENALKTNIPTWATDLI